MIHNQTYTIPVDDQGSIAITVPGILDERIPADTVNLMLNPTDDSFKIVAPKFEIQFHSGKLVSITVN